MLCLYRDGNFRKQNSVIKKLSDALSGGKKVFIVDLDEALFFQFSYSKSKMREENANLILFFYPHAPVSSVLQYTEKYVSIVHWQIAGSLLMCVPSEVFLRVIKILLRRDFGM